MNWETENNGYEDGKTFNLMVDGLPIAWVESMVENHGTYCAPAFKVSSYTATPVEGPELTFYVRRPTRRSTITDNARTVLAAAKAYAKTGKVPAKYSNLKFD